MIGQTCTTRIGLGLLLSWGALGCSSGSDAVSGGASGTGGNAGASASESANGSANSTSTTSTGDGTSGSGGSSSVGGTTGSASSTAGDATAGSEGGASAGSGGASGELPYADVVAVSVSGAPGAYTFAVSIESADIDCSQYADFWEVLSETGELILRHTLTHSHTDENGTTDENAPGNTFTRSGGPVPIDAEEVVIVRAHLSNLDEYNGVAMRGSAAAGFMVAPDIGPRFALDVLDAPPEPPACLF